MIKKTILLSTAILGVAAIGLNAFADDKAATKTKPEKKITSAVDLFPETLYNAEGEEVSRDQLKGKIVGIYFSAHWCPPCRAFTPSLVKFRNQNKDDFEIVFVSSDKNEAAQMQYMKDTKMKWTTVKFGTKKVKALKDRYKVRGIPKLIIVGPDGKTITDDGRGDVSKKAATAIDAWKAKAGKTA
ncbi:MAG: nucleoredoxin [Pseudoalteromonas tetraodonis]|jgi:nucleoredoxin